MTFRSLKRKYKKQDLLVHLVPGQQRNQIFFTKAQKNIKATTKLPNFKECFRNVIIPSRRVLKTSRELGKNILRRLDDIYRKIYSEFIENDTVKRSSLTKDEIKQLFSLQELHGNKWKLIGKIMGRKERQVSNCYHNYHSPHALTKVRRKPSSRARTDVLPSEDEKLLRIIMEHTTSKNGKLMSYRSTGYQQQRNLVLEML